MTGVAGGGECNIIKSRGGGGERKLSSMIFAPKLN